MTTIMRASTYTLGENGLEKDQEYPIQVGQILFLNGYGQTVHNHERLAVYKIEHTDFGPKYYCVNLDKPSLCIKDHVEPVEKLYGIGIYFKQGDIATQEEIDEVMPMALAAEKVKNDKAERIGKENVESAKKWWAENTPAWAKSFIIAEFEINESDSMTDYFGSRTDKTLLLAFSATERNNFDELRNACKGVEGLEHLVEKNDRYEHRENYSGGAGYFLGKHRYSGWNVSKVSLKWKIGQGTFVLDPANIRIKKEITPVAPSGQQPTGDKIAICKLNAERGGIELYFNSKPAQAVLDDLKGKSWRWSKFNKCWYRLDNPIARQQAAKYAYIPTESEQDGLLVQAQEDAASDRFAQENGI